ncbi:hypothetical protein GCM10027059_44560 [Myceligenerans halotolerans]
MVDHDDPAEALRSIDDVASLRQAQSEWLLDQYVEPQFHGCDGKIAMGRGWGCDGNRVDGVSGSTKFGDILQHGGARICSSGCISVIAIGFNDRGQRRAVALVDSASEVAPPVSESDQRD